MSLKLTALTAAALACVGVATAQAKGPIVLSQVAWAKTPSRADVAEAFASASARPGDRVALLCRIDLYGALRNCAADPDGPSADAALRLARQFRVDLDPLGAADIYQLRVRLVVQAPDATAPHVIASPDWIRTLSADRIQEVFPPKAADAGLGTGRAVLDCVADAGGMMTACQVLSEDPVGMDFGPAAMRVASAMGVSPWSDDGLPAEGAHVKFAIRLNRQEPSTSASAH